VKGLQTFAAFWNDVLCGVRLDCHLCLTVFSACDFSHLMRPNYGPRTKITLSGTLKTILLETNGNLALWIVTPVDKIVTLRGCEGRCPYTSEHCALGIGPWI